MEGESIATSTMSPLAARGNERNRRSVRASCRMPRSPVRSASASTHATRKCGLYCFTLLPPWPFLVCCSTIAGVGGRRPMTATSRLPLLLSRRLLDFSSPPPLHRNGHGDDGADHEWKGERERIDVSPAAEGPLAQRSQVGTPSAPLGAVALRQRRCF